MKWHHHSRRSIFFGGFVALILIGISAFAFGMKQRIFASGTSYYVSPTGSDSASGTEQEPWKKINKCITALSAGDTCVARGGTYTDVVDVSGKSGSSGAPITLRNYPGEKPIIDGINATGQSTMLLRNMKYFVMDGITVVNSRAYGIYTENSQYITAKNCEVAYPLDGGMIWKDSSNILVDSCDVHHTNDRGNGSHEAVSFAGDTSDFEIKNSTVRNSKEEGIDAKYGARNGLIHHNRVFGNNGPNVYVDGASFVKIYNNEIFGATGDKPNISIAGERPDYVVKDISIYNNIVYNSAGGISFFIISMPTPFENIYIYHNLMYNNTSRGGLRTNDYAMNNVVVKNNIFWRNSPNIDKVGNAIVDNNLFNTGADARQNGTNARTVDNVGFVSESGKDFHLTDASPAINTGISVPVSTDFDGVTRPQGSAFDIGPYELGGIGIVNNIPTPTRVPTSTPTRTPTPVAPSATPTPAFVCPVGQTGDKQASMTFSLSQIGNYKLWVYMKGNGDSSNTVWASLDNLYCVKVGDKAGMSTEWEWTDYQNGSTTQEIPSPLLSTGNHTITFYGNTMESGVSVDRVLLTRDTTCVPDGTGDACIGIVSSPTATATVIPTATLIPTPTPVVTGGLKRKNIVTGKVQSNSSTNVRTSTVMPAEPNQLYVAAISTKSNIAVGNVSGLGLTWYPAAAQCGGRSQTRTELWWAYGSPSSNDYITASFSNPKRFRSAVIAAVSYDGAASNPIRQVVRKNSKGISDTTCSRGSDQDQYSYSIVGSNTSGVWISAVGLRQLGHIPTNNGVEVVEVHTSRGGGDDSGVAVVEYLMKSVSTLPIGGVFTGKVDYSAVGVEFAPR